MLAGAAIDWRSKLQPTVALSTVEAEAMALCAATVEVEYTRGGGSSTQLSVPAEN